MAVSRRADTTSEGLLLEYVLMQNETSTRIQKALTNVPWLSASSQATRQYLASQSSLEQVADGTTVAWCGRQVTHLLSPIRGSLELSITNAQGKRHVLLRLVPGKVFGLIPVLDDSGAIHDVVARGACEIVRVPQAALRHAMRTDAELSDQVIRLLCAQARRTYHTLASHTLSAMPVRIARTLLNQVDGSGSYAVSLTQADLADMLGTTRQSLNVELKRLERKGLVCLGRGRIEIKDSAQLEQLAMA